MSELSKEDYNKMMRERHPVENVIITPKITELRKKLEEEHRRYRSKCMECRETGDGADINEAHQNIKHNPNCNYIFGVSTFFDSIDLSITNHF